MMNQQMILEQVGADDIGTDYIEVAADDCGTNKNCS